ncbi:MAG: RNA polymerase sigma factor RpoD/SigA [Candidatus Sumerlaeia bacterium]|nr:RNA polymerase sigma factor RpoD/SigA [Candidatus Sumerlaeia bacterium]
MATRNRANCFEDGVSTYLGEVGDHPVLTREEEQALFQRLETGDDAAREELVRCNLRFVVKIALKYRHCGVPLADLIQEGNIGLLTVLDKFDWRRGYRFSTYAAFWIRQEIQAAVRQRANLIRLPVRKARLLAKMEEQSKAFAMREGREPNVEELAAELAVEVEKIEALLPFRDAVMSLEAERSEDGACLLDAMCDEGAPAPGDDLLEEERCRLVRDAFRHLSDREREVVSHRYGFREDGRALSLRKTSAIVGLSQEGVRRVEMRALGKLGRPAVSAPLRDLLIA